MHYTKHILENGTRVILAPMENTQTVTVQIMVEAGSKHENKSNNGISHFLEHMMFKGTKKRPSYKVITELLDGTGGDSNAFTGKEETGYYVKVPAGKAKLALDLVSDIYLNSLFRQKDIDVERGVILQEKAMYQDLPQRYVWEIFEQLLYGDQPAGWDIVGTEKVIKSLKRKDFLDYWRKKYLPGSTVVVVAGKFKEDEILKQIKESFFQKSNQRKIGKKKVVQSQGRPQVKVHHKQTDQSHLVVGFRGPDMFSPDRYAESLLATVLGGGMSSRMFERVREKNGLAYYISAAAEQSTDTGYLVAFAGVEHQNLTKALKMTLDEFKKVAEKKVYQKELSKVKEQFKGKMLMHLESSDQVASFLGGQELHHKKVKVPAEILAEIEKVQLDDILKVARKIIQPKNLNLALIGPKIHQVDELQAILNKF